MNLIRSDLTRPSSTITAATLAAMGATLVVEIILQAGVELRPTLGAAFVTFVSALVGYFAEEHVLPLRREPDEHEAGGP